MKYIKIGKTGQIQTYWTIENIDNIPSTKGDDVVLVWTTHGTRISLFGKECCSRFLAEFEYPLNSVLDWTEEKMNVMPKKNSLTFYDCNNVIVFEY